MADNENKLKSGNGSSGTTADARPTARLKLAHDSKIVRAKTDEEGGGFEMVYHTPPTENGEVNIGDFGAIFLPPLEEQKSGFTPYRVAKKVATAAGVNFWFDKDSGDEAVRVLLEQFPGIYKRVTEKGE